MDSRSQRGKETREESRRLWLLDESYLEGCFQFLAIAAASFLSASCLIYAYRFVASSFTHNRVEMRGLCGGPVLVSAWGASSVDVVVDCCQPPQG